MNGALASINGHFTPQENPALWGARPTARAVHGPRGAVHGSRIARAAGRAPEVETPRGVRAEGGSDEGGGERGGGEGGGAGSDEGAGGERVVGAGRGRSARGRGGTGAEEGVLAALDGFAKRVERQAEKELK